MIDSLVAAFSQLSIQDRGQGSQSIERQRIPQNQTRELRVAQQILLRREIRPSSPLLCLLQESPLEQRRRVSLLSLLEEATCSREPVKFLLDRFHEIEFLFQKEPRFTPIIKNVRFLLQQSAETSTAIPRPLWLLLEGVFINNPMHGGMTAFEGFSLSSHMLLLQNTPLQDRSLALLCQDAKRKARNRLLAFRQEASQQVDVYARTGIYNPTDLRIQQIPFAIAKALLLPNGTLNIGIIDLVNEVFLPEKTLRDSLENYIASVLHALEIDKKAQEALETLPPPKQDRYGARIVNASLMRPFSSPVTAYEARLTCLASCLTYWRQHNLSSCVLDSALQEIQNSSLVWLINDIGELLLTEAIVRCHDRIRIPFLGLEVPEPMAYDAPFDDIRILRETNLGTCLTSHLQLADSDWEAIIQSHPKSLRNLFESLNHIFPGRFEEKDLTRALLLIESPIQSPVLRVLQNAMGSSLNPPASAYLKPRLEHPKTALRWLFEFFDDIARENKLEHLQSKIKHFCSFLELYESPSSPIPRPEGSALQEFSRIHPQWVPCPELPCRGPDYAGSGFAFFFEEKGILRPLSKNEFPRFLFYLFKKLYQEVYHGDPLPSSITSGTFHADRPEVLGAIFFECNGFSDRVPVLERIFPPHPFERKSPQETTVPGFVGWLQRMRELQKGDFSFLAFTNNHCFRLMPNDPSIGDQPIFSLKMTILNLDVKTRQGIESAFQKIPSRTRDELIDEFVAQCAKEVQVSSYRDRLEASFEPDQISQIQSLVRRGVTKKPLAYSLFDFSTAIPSIIKESIVNVFQPKLDLSDVFKNRPKEWIVDHLQISGSTDQFIQRLYLQAIGVPPVSSLPQIDKDPLFRAEILSKDFVEKSAKEVLLSPAVYTKFLTAIRILIQNACQEVTLSFDKTTLAAALTRAEIINIQRAVKSRIEDEIGRRDRSVFETISMTKAIIHEEIAHALLITQQHRFPPAARGILVSELSEIIKLSRPSCEMNYCLIMALADGEQRFRRSLIHFGDSNYGTPISDTFQAEHYCFWYDPISLNWLIVTAAETGAWHEGIRVESMRISDIFLVDSRHQILEEAQRKEDLASAAYGLKKCHELERAFADSLDTFYRSFLKLGKEDQRHFIDSHRRIAPIHFSLEGRVAAAREILSVDPAEGLLEALQRCRKIIAIHQALRLDL
jgi:hypothetical protein